MALEGTLHDMPLRDIIQVVRDTRQTGVLTLETRSEHADVYLADGVLRDAIITLQGDQRVLATGEAAVRYLARWETATFVFRYDRAASNHPARVSAEAYRLLYKTVRVENDTCVMLGIPFRNDGDVRLSRLEWRLVCQIGTGASVGELALRTGLSEEYARDLVDALLARELLDIVVVPTNRLIGNYQVTSRGRVQSPVATPVLNSVIQFVHNL